MPKLERVRGIIHNEEGNRWGPLSQQKVVIFGGDLHHGPWHSIRVSCTVVADAVCGEGRGPAVLVCGGYKADSAVPGWGDWLPDRETPWARVVRPQPMELLHTATMISNARVVKFVGTQIC